MWFPKITGLINRGFGIQTPSLSSKTELSHGATMNTWNLFLTAALFRGNGVLQPSYHRLHCQPRMHEAPETEWKKAWPKITAWLLTREQDQEVRSCVGSFSRWQILCWCFLSRLWEEGSEEDFSINIHGGRGHRKGEPRSLPRPLWVSETRLPLWSPSPPSLDLAGLPFLPPAAIGHSPHFAVLTGGKRLLAGDIAFYFSIGAWASPLGL